jgi:hypothetical protein
VASMPNSALNEGVRRRFALITSQDAKMTRMAGRKGREQMEIRTEASRRTTNHLETMPSRHIMGVYCG